MRAEMGRDLARRRRAAGLSQEQLAALAGYSRATVSHAELGADDVAGGLWAAADRVLGTGGLFAGLHEQVRQECLEPGRRAAVRAGGTGIGCELALKAAEPGQALAAYRRRGWPVAARGEVLELLAGRWAEVLEVGRTAGQVAAGAWLESVRPGGAACGLPRLPAPEAALAVIDAGDRWFFLIRSGFPVPTSGHAGGGAEIFWHSAGGRVPLPPSRAGRAVRWAHLPAAVLDLAPPLAVLDLLGWAVAMTAVPGRLRLPGGAVVAPAGPAGINPGPAPARRLPESTASLAGARAALLAGGWLWVGSGQQRGQDITIAPCARYMLFRGPSPAAGCSPGLPAPALQPVPEASWPPAAAAAQRYPQVLSAGATAGTCGPA
jgi:hypothetical protein